MRIILRKHLLFSPVFMFLLLISAVDTPLVSAQNNTALYLIKEGKTSGHIYIPRICTRSLRFAAKELQDHFALMTGVVIPYATKSEPIRAQSGIVLKVRDKSKWVGKESPQAFTIAQQGNFRRVTIEGNTSLAVLYGVYQYLDDLGVRWFTPGKVGTTVPRKDIAVITGKKAHTPSFIGRGITLNHAPGSRFHFGDDISRIERSEEYYLWLVRNRIHYSGAKFDFNTIDTDSGHMLRIRTNLRRRGRGPKPADITKEPERFALVTRNNVQERIDGGQICFTNKKNIQVCIDNCVSYFKKRSQDPDWDTDLDEEVNNVIDVGLSDAAGICECDACTKVSGDGPYSIDRLVWSFMNKVARGLDKELPGKKITLHAPYFTLTQPPKDVKLESNIIAKACRCFPWIDTKEDRAQYPFTSLFNKWIKATSDAGAEIHGRDYTLWHHTPQSSSLLDAVEGYYKMGVRRYYVEVMQRNEQMWPLWWAMARYTWDTSKKPHVYLEEFCNQYYGAKAGKIVLDLQRAIDVNTKTQRYIGYGSLAHTSGILTDSLIVEFRKRLKFLDRGMKSHGGLEYQRVRRYCNAMEMQFKLAETYRAYCTALNGRTAAQIKIFQKKAKQFERYWHQKDLSAICSSGTALYGGAVHFVRDMAKVDFNKLKPKARSAFNLQAEIRDTTSIENKQLSKKIKMTEGGRWLQELYASPTPVKKAPNNLFPLPEVWDFQLDILDKGLEKGWEKTGFDDSKWNKISTWNFIESQGYVWVGGRYWYRTTVTAPKFPKGKKVFMRIGSLDDSGDIYINGKYVGSQMVAENWNRSFEIDITAALKQGEKNVIAIRGYDCGMAAGMWRPAAFYTD